MNKKSNLLFLIILICFTSCDKKRIFDEYKSVGQTWHKDSVVSFSFSQKDTLKPYNLFVNLRNNNKYPYNNLFFEALLGLYIQSYHDALTDIQAQANAGVQMGHELLENIINEAQHDGAATDATDATDANNEN